MLISRLTEPLNTTVHFRPVRVAFFVPDEPAAFVRAATIATSQWGGLHCVVVPVTPERTPSCHNYFRRVLELVEPDLFVELSQADQAFRRAVQTILEELFPWRSIQLRYGDDFEHHDRSMHALSVVTDDARAKRDMRLPRVEGWAEAVNAAVFGRVGQADLSHYAATLGTLGDAPVELAAIWESQHASEWSASAINLTAYGLSPIVVTDGFEAPWFDLVVGGSVSSLCLFWAIRAVREMTQFASIGRRTVLCTVHDLADPQHAIGLVSMLRSHLAVEGVLANVDLLVHTWTEDDYAAASSALERLAPDLLRSTSDRLSVSHQFGQSTRVDAPSERVLTFAFVAPDLPGSFRAGTGRATSRPISWKEGPDNSVERAPVTGLNVQWGNVAIDVECDLWTRFPKAQEVAALVKPEGWFSRWGLSRIDGLPNAVGYDRHSLPTEWAAMEAWFRSAGFGIRMSQAGKYAESAVTVLGGVDAITAIATRQAYRLMEKLSLKSSKKVAQRLARILKESDSVDEAQLISILADLEIGPELKGVPRGLNQLMHDRDLDPKADLPATVAELVRRGVVVRGLFVTCIDCGSSEWYQLAELDERIACRGCGSVQPLDLLDGSGNELRWQFRLNSLFNRAVDQDTVPNALALFRLRSRAGGTCCALGMELLGPDGQAQHELDFVYVSGGRVVGGECKAGMTLSAKDIETARVAANCGFSEFWFATVSDRWSDEADNLVGELRGEALVASMRIGMLTADHLFGVQTIPMPTVDDHRNSGRFRQPRRN